MNFAQNLKLLRQSRKLTQARLAELADISLSSVINYENSRRKDPSTSIVERLAKALSVPVEILIAEDVFWIEKYLITGEFYKTKTSDDAHLSENYKNTEMQPQRRNYESSLEIAFCEISMYLKFLNETGLKEAVKRISELTMIPTYTAPMSEYDFKSIAG